MQGKHCLVVSNPAPCAPALASAHQVAPAALAAAAPGRGVGGAVAAVADVAAVAADAPVGVRAAQALAHRRAQACDAGGRDARGTARGKTRRGQTIWNKQTNKHTHTYIYLHTHTNKIKNE